MEFLLKINKKLDVISLGHLSNEKDEDNSFLYLDNKKYFKKHKNKKAQLFWLGDLIMNENTKTTKAYLDDMLENFEISKVIKTGGFFYCIWIDFQNKCIQVFNSFLGILPLYYYEFNNSLFVSSSSTMIRKYLKHNLPISKKFILEKLLFNYPFRNQSLYEGIESVPSNSYIKFNGKVSIIKHTNISDWFVQNPTPWRQALPSITEYFKDRVKYYFPDELFYLSFTSGFDGRTLLSMLLNSNKNYKTYSFGIREADDITIPLKQSEELGVLYKPFYLDDMDYVKSSLNYGLELVRISDGTANFARAHYTYAAEKISTESNYLITGNFGSELFRAMHNTGEVISKALFYLLSAANIEEAINALSRFSILNVLPEKKYTDALEELKSDLIDDSLFKGGFPLNRRFYKYVFEEIFRKYFGAEIKMQFNKLINRSPFIDPPFTKELLKTQLSGAYSNFYESNPVRRFKGQVFYAEIIKQFSKKLLNMKTGKGYSPRALISLFGKGILVINFLKKRIKISKDKQDFFGVDRCLRHNTSFLDDLPIQENYFIDIKKQGISGMSLNDKINYYSLNWLINKYQN